MKPEIFDRKQAQRLVGLWTPWGIQHCVRDEKTPAPRISRKSKAGQWPVPAMIAQSDHHQERAPQR